MTLFSLTINQNLGLFRYTYNMVKSSPLLLQQISNKVWNATIKIPELKATLPAFESTFDLNEAADLLTDMFKSHKGKILVVTGAGVSTDSGIPDYRGDHGTYVRNPNHRPILYHELSSSDNYRQRYWSRSYLGWPKMSEALPNDTHHILKSLLSDHNYIQNIITQNVDHLHSKVGTPSNRLLELHGTLYKVECMNCGDISVDRRQYQNRLHARNSQKWGELIVKNINPDGDAELPKGVKYEDFDIPPCLNCNSCKTKPKVVFFGENIKQQVTDQAEKFVRDSSAVVIIGSSLATYSSYRLIRLANQLMKPIGIITKGPTRADNIMNWKAEVGCTPLLKKLYSNLIGP